MKKNLFFNRFPFLLAIAALFMLVSCQTQKSEQEIRAQVEKEIMLKLDSILQPPKNVLSASDSRLVADKFKDIKIQAGVETTLCTLENKTVVSFLMDKDFNYNLYAQFDGKKEIAQMSAYIPIVYSDLFAHKIGDCISSPASCGLQKPKKQIVEHCIETYSPDVACNDKCAKDCEGRDELNRPLCEWYCVFKRCPPIKTKICSWVVVPSLTN